MANGRAVGEDAPERVPEVGVAQRVQHGVERRVDVAEPQRDLRQRAVDAVRAHGHHEEHDEVRQPAHDERAHDDAELAGGLALVLSDEARRGRQGVRAVGRPHRRPLRPLVHVLDAHGDVRVVGRLAVQLEEREAGEALERDGRPVLERRRRARAPAELGVLQPGEQRRAPAERRLVDGLRRAPVRLGRLAHAARRAEVLAAALADRAEYPAVDVDHGERRHVEVGHGRRHLRRQRVWS